MNCADNNHETGLWNTLLDASWYRVDSRLVTIGMLLMSYQVSAFSSLAVDDSAAVSLRYVLTRDWMTIFCVFQFVPFVLPAVFLVISLLYMCTHGHPHISSYRPLKTSSHPAVHIQVSPVLTENPSEVVPSFPFGGGAAWLLRR